MRKVRKIVDGIRQSHLEGRDFLGENRAIELELRISGVFLEKYVKKGAKRRKIQDRVCLYVYIYV